MDSTAEPDRRTGTVAEFAHGSALPAMAGSAERSCRELPTASAEADGAAASDAVAAVGTIATVGGDDGVRTATTGDGPGAADATCAQRAAEPARATRTGEAAVAAVATKATGDCDGVIRDATGHGPGVTDATCTAGTTRATRATDLTGAQAVAGCAAGPGQTTDTAGDLDRVTERTASDNAGATDTTSATDTPEAAGTATVPGTADTARTTSATDTARSPGTAKDTGAAEATGPADTARASGVTGRVSADAARAGTTCRAESAGCAGDGDRVIARPVGDGAVTGAPVTVMLSLPAVPVNV